MHVLRFEFGLWGSIFCEKVQDTQSGRVRDGQGQNCLCLTFFVEQFKDVRILRPVQGLQRV